MDYVCKQEAIRQIDMFKEDNQKHSQELQDKLDQYKANLKSKTA